MKLAAVLKHVLHPVRAVLAILLVSAGLLGGFCAETVYTRAQLSDGADMKAPIIFTVRVRIEATSNIVELMQDAEGANGVTNRQFTTYGDSADSGCSVFDNTNWRCTRHGPDGIYDWLEMKDGDLSRIYFAETQIFERRLRMLNFTL